MATCVVIASSAQVRSVLEASLHDLRLQVRAISTLGELPTIAREAPVGGILLELTTSLQSPPEEKEATHEILRLYPFARFRLNGKTISTLGDGNSLEQFAERCRQFRPRVTRREVRERRHLAVYLGRDASLKDAEQTVTIDMSLGGCFVFSSRTWRVGDCVWLRFSGEEMARSGTVCFWRAWGSSGGIPGIGIRLDVEPRT